MKTLTILIALALISCTTAQQTRMYPPLTIAADNGSHITVNITVNADVNKAGEIEQKPKGSIGGGLDNLAPIDVTRPRYL
jgi:hypothetical protein